MMFTTMIVKSKLLTQSFLLQICAYQYAVKRSTKKEQPKQSGIIIKNDNLKFQTSDYFIHVFPFLPQIIKKNTSLYQINKYSTVLALTFVKKQGTQTYDSMLQKNNNNTNSQTPNPWSQRKSYAFKFNQISKIISVSPNSEKESILQRKKYLAPDSTQKKIIKKLKIIDLKEEKQIGFKLHEAEQLNNGQQNKLWQLKTKMPYQEFQVMSYLIKESLFDLSGLKLMFDLKRNEELAKFSKKQQGAKEVQDLMKEYETKKEDDRVV